MAKAKTLLLSCKKTHTHFFLTWMRINHHFCIYLAMSLVKDMYTPSHFKISLAEPLNFRDPHNWEVILSELYFPSSYYKISQDNNSNLTIQL